MNALAQSRRGFLKSLVAVGAVGLAGAIGVATRIEESAVTVSSKMRVAWVSGSFLRVYIDGRQPYTFTIDDGDTVTVLPAEQSESTTPTKQ